MSLAAWHLLILWMQLVHCPRMSTARFPYVSEFEYVPRLHPSRNPDCPSRFPRNRQVRDEFSGWDRPSIEVKAVLSSCSKLDREKTFDTLGDRLDARWERNYEEEDQGTAMNCTRKILISLKFTNIGKTQTEEKFVVIDHVLDPATMKKIPLHSPFVIKIRQETVLQMYGLKFQSVVNAEAREEVINNESPNYMGCNVDPGSPTCGQTFYHQEPVPFSQGFCCSCDPKRDARHRFGGSNDSLESFHAGAKSNYNDGTNKPSNRLRTETEYASVDDNPMAQRQTVGNEARSEKKPNTDANADRSRTIGSSEPVPDSCLWKDAQGKPIHAIPAKGSCRDQETEVLSEFLATRTSQASTSTVTNSILPEKYSSKQVEGSSTSVSPLSPEVEAGRPPSGDKIASRVDVAQDRASKRMNEVPEIGAGRTGDTARNQDRGENGDEPKHRSRLEESANHYGYTSVAKNSQSAMETGSNLREPVIRKKGTGIGKERGIAHVARLVDSSVVKELEKGANQSPGVIRLEDPLRSTKYGYRKNLATGRSVEKDASGKNEEDSGGKGCGKCWLAETVYGDKGSLVKSGKKRNKVFPVASAIDSPAIRLAMHLDEPLKNLPTGVSNGNRSPSGREASERGNLNRVMESTFPLSDIIVKSLTQNSRVDGCVRSNVNEASKGIVVEDMVLAKILVTEDNASPKNDSCKRQKKLLTKEAIKNYTPQKRTLKDLSYRSNYNVRGAKSLHRRDANSRRTKANFRRSRRHLRGRKEPRSTRRGRRKRGKKMDDDKGTASGNRNPGPVVQVYIDNSKLQRGRANGESKSGKLAHNSANNEMPGMADGKERGMAKSRDEANRRDSVDKQIEEKFSRISDALKEDAMGLKAISKETQEERTKVDQQDEKKGTFPGGVEPRNEFDRPKDRSSRLRNNETPGGVEPRNEFDRPNDRSSRLRNNETPGETGEATETVLHENADEFKGEAPQNSFAGSYQSIKSIKKYNEPDANENIYLEPRKDQEVGEGLFASQQSNPSVNKFDDFMDKSSTTTNSNPFISPTIESSINKQIQATSSLSALEEAEDAELMNAPNWMTEEAPSKETQALIVIDVFKVATDSLQQLPFSPDPKGIFESGNQVVDKEEGSKHLRQSFELKPVHGTVQTVKTTTLLLTESTVATEKPTVVESTMMTGTTNVQTTMITDGTFRASIKPLEGSRQTVSGGAEFHEEISVDETTFIDETNAPTTTTDRAIASVHEKFVGLESISSNTAAIQGYKKLRMGYPGRKKKRTPPAMIKSKDLSLYRGADARRDDRSLCSGNPLDCGRGKGSTRPDSAMKFSLEAGNVDLVKGKMGVTSSFFRERRNYVQLRVDGRDKHRTAKAVQFSPEIYEPREVNEAEGGNQGEVHRRRDASSNRMFEWMHPWLATTETSENTVRPKFHYNRVFPSNSKSRSSESPSNQGTDNVPGRILPPCSSNRGRLVEDDGAENVACETEVNQRGRRLLSVQSFKGIKNAADHRSTKNRKKIHDEEENFINGQDSDAEYEEEAREHRKHLKSVRGKDHEKSKKRDASRSAMKRKNKEKNRSKKQSISEEDSSKDYNYLLPEEQEYDDGGTFIEERQADVPNNPEELFENYEGAADWEENLEKDLDGAMKTSEEQQDYSSYNRLIDDTVGFDTGSLGDQGQAATIGEEKSKNGDVRNEKGPGTGEDFEISLTGKIHLQSDSNGRPVSISFNAAPEFTGKDSTGDGKMYGYGNRFPSEPASSFINASDTLAALGTDNANFLPDVLDVQLPLNAPLDSAADGGDRSNAQEYYPDPTRATARNVERYGGNPLENRPQRLLHLRKKSVESGGDPAKGETRSSKDSTDVNGRCSGSNGNLNHLKKESSSLARDANFVPEETEAEEDEQSSDIDQNESSGVEDRNRAVLSFNEDSLKKTPAESLEALPQISIDLSNVPEISFAGEQIENPNTTMQNFDFPEMTTIREKVGDYGSSTVAAYQNMKVTVYPSSAETSEQLGEATRMFKYGGEAERFEEAAAQYPNSAPNFEGEDKGSIEKKNMLAVEDFVKKLENLVSDTGNVSNTTGHTLIHLKKFIIVPDNQTLWGMKDIGETVQQTTSKETVIMIGEGTAYGKSNKNSLEGGEKLKQPETEMDQKSKVDDSNLIKEIISSVIRGNNAKRDVAPKKADELSGQRSPAGQTTDVKAVDGTAENEVKDRPGKQELDTCPKAGKNGEDSEIHSERASTKEDASLRNVGRNTGDQILETYPENAKEPLKKDSVVCTENTSNAKEKREASASNANSVSHKRGNKSQGKRKDARHVKKKRRKKRRRKMKKKKGGKKKKKAKKAKSKWPFKRNLLMLSEKEQIETSSKNDGTRWKIPDRFSLYEGNARTARSPRKSRRENMSKEPHIRGGQDCRDNRHPRNVDLLSYMKSTHCLRFSDLWYSVYQLEEPVIHRTVHIDIYEKRTSIDGSISWRDLTNGSTIRLGTFDRHYRNKEDTVVLSYNDVKSRPYAEYNLDPAKDRLLVPSTLTGERSTYPQAKGWSGEYLVVQADKINEDANECDKAGVGFTAFVGQPDRCGRVRGTCLKNQPLAYWRHDMEARESGRAGCYFLSNFAWVSSEAIKYNVNGTGSREFLALEYHSPHVSVIDVELRADYNALLRAGSSVRLTEVHVDNTAIDYTVVTVLITNRGSSSSPYRARITDCPKGLPVSWLNAESPAKTVSPHHDRKITFDLNGRLSLDEFSCSVELLNRDGEPVATRQIKVRKMDRCFCVRHCMCSCMANAHGTSCQPMLLENYHAAGFRGSIPTTPVKSPIWSYIITILALLLTALLLLLPFMGFLKWIIGICVPAVGRWGLDAILGTAKMKEYFEKDLKSKPVVFDQFGAPVHPDTGRKTVRICNRKLEFFLNLLFFLLYPFAICVGSRAKPQRPSQPHSTTDSKASLVSEKDEPPTMVRVSTYGDGINSKMEAEDTKYVIDELKKSQESLQNHSRQKRSREIAREPSSSD